MKNKRKIISAARNKVQDEISSFARSRGEGIEGLYARGLASEGYNGGYRDALDDCILLLSGVSPNRGNWWD
jgi:hypothetical protein